MSLHIRVTDLAQRVAELRAADAQADPVLLDVREAGELAIARIQVPGARLLHIPLHTLPARLSELNRQQPIFTLCHHGMRSLQAALFLRQQGFDAATNIADGIDAWSLQVDPQVPRY